MNQQTKSQFYKVNKTEIKKVRLHVFRIGYEEADKSDFGLRNANTADILIAISNQLLLILNAYTNFSILFFLNMYR
jgi:hypothetical protein